MSYATPQDMIDEFGQREMRAIGDPDATGEMVVERVQNALDKASDQIDFAAGQRCALPLDTSAAQVQTFLRQLCMDIARYRLTGSSGITATDEVRDRYREADAKLQQIIAGKIILCAQVGIGTGAPAGGLRPDNLTAGEAEVNVDAPRVFGPGALNDFLRGTWR